MRSLTHDRQDAEWHPVVRCVCLSVLCLPATPQQLAWPRAAVRGDAVQVDSSAKTRSWILMSQNPELGQKPSCMACVSTGINDPCLANRSLGMYTMNLLRLAQTKQGPIDGAYRFPLVSPGIQRCCLEGVSEPCLIRAPSSLGLQYGYLYETAAQRGSFGRCIGLASTQSLGSI